MEQYVIKKAHCLFEQSGTFKNEFKKLGIDAEDYDILNQFGETDHVSDLFREIEVAYDGGQSIFDNIKKDEIALAFFPCTEFEVQKIMFYRGEAFQQKNKSDEIKLMDCIKFHERLHRNYVLISKMAIVALRKNVKMVIENPYSSQHYLTRYWSLKPKVIDDNRTLHGDAYQKPTQYWFINCEPKNNLIMDGVELKKRKRIEDGNTVERSMIEHDYARWFIREFVLDESQIDRGY